MMTEKPLSPHLQVYRWQLTMVLSILHRMAGAALAVGTVMIVWMLLALASSEQAYGHFYAFVTSGLGQVMIFGWSAALCYHLCNGVRHLFWDCGYLFEIKNAYRAGYAVLICAAVFLFLIWALSMADNYNLQTPLARARGHGSTKEGTAHWWHQRITAVANLFLMLWLLCAVVRMGSWEYAFVYAWMTEPVNAILLILAVISVFYHAALGSQVIVEDYIHHEGLKMLKLVSIRLFFLAAGVTCVFSIMKVSFGV